MNKYRIIFFAIFLYFESMGQSLSQLLKDKNISWIASIEQDWILDQSGYLDTLTHVNYAELLKWSRPINLAYTYRNELIRRVILSGIQSGTMPVFSDSVCTNRIFYENLIEKDTFVSPCNGDTVVVHRELELEDFLYFRTHSFMYYNTQKACFNAAYVSVAMMVKDKKIESDTPVYKPLCWIKVENKIPENWQSDPNINFAVTTWSRSGRNYLNLENIDLEKTPSSPASEPRTHLFNLAAHPLPQQKNETFLSHDYWDMKILSLDQRRKIIASQDTTEEYNSSTDQTIVSIKNKVILPTDIKEFRVVQTWYWNSEKKKLFITFDAVAPMYDVRGDDGVFRFKKPLFYRPSN